MAYAASFMVDEHPGRSHKDDDQYPDTKQGCQGESYVIMTPAQLRTFKNHKYIEENFPEMTDILENVCKELKEDVRINHIEIMKL